MTQEPTGRAAHPANGPGEAGTSGFSRRRLLGLPAALAVSAALGAAIGERAFAAEPDGLSTAVDAPMPYLPPDGVLGGNYNEELVSIRFRELEAARARWVRGFYTMPLADQADPATDPGVRAILTAAERGYGTVLSLKSPYPQAPMPTPGSADMQVALARLDKVLPVVMGHVDILVIGNEPFIESRPEDRDETLNVFYETIAAHVIAYRARTFGPRCRTRLYMGALNRLDLPDRRTPAAERWMEYVRETPEIDGTDMHPHVPTPDATQPFLDFIVPRLRADQTFLVTEFSLVWYWKQHLSDPVPDLFAQRYGFATGTPVWQAIQAAIANPFTQQQWDDLLSLSPWFESQKHFLVDQMNRFRATGRLAVATYGMRQGNSMVRDFGPNKVPWLLNSVFAPYTVQPGVDGLTGQGYAWIDDFRALQIGRGYAEPATG